MHTDGKVSALFEEIVQGTGQGMLLGSSRLDGLETRLTAPFHGVQNEDVSISRACSWVVLFWLLVLGLGLHKFFFIACGFFSMIHLNLI